MDLRKARLEVGVRFGVYSCGPGRKWRLTVMTDREKGVVLRDVDERVTELGSWHQVGVGGDRVTGQMLVPFFFLRKEEIWGEKLFVFDMLCLGYLCEPEEASAVLERI